MEEKRKRATGRANTIAATPLNRIPSFMKNPRRERRASVGGAISVFPVSVFVDILFLRLLRRRWLRIVHYGVRLPRILRAPRRQPGNNVRDFLIGHWTPRDIG